MTIKTIFFIFLFFTISSYSQGTENEIKTELIENPIPEYLKIDGIVLDLMPISNVVVIEKGKNNFATTDRDGKFTMKIPLKNFTEKVFLRFELLPQKPKEIEIFPNTKYIKAQLNQKDENAEKWQFEYVYEKPDVANLVIKTLAFIIENVKMNNYKKDKDKKDKGKKDKGKK